MYTFGLTQGNGPNLTSPNKLDLFVWQNHILVIFFSNLFPQAIGFYQSQQSLWWTRICPEGWQADKICFCSFPHSIGVKVSPMLAFRSIFSPGPEMPPFPGFPNKAHRSPVHLIYFYPIPGRPRPLSECNRQKQVYLTYIKNIIRSAVKSRGKCLILSIKR